MTAPSRTEPANKNQYGIPYAQIFRRLASADFLGRKQFRELLARPALTAVVVDVHLPALLDIGCGL